MLSIMKNSDAVAPCAAAFVAKDICHKDLVKLKTLKSSAYGRQPMFFNYVIFNLCSEVFCRKNRSREFPVQLHCMYLHYKNFSAPAPNSITHLGENLNAEKNVVERPDAGAPDATTSITDVPDASATSAGASKPEEQGKEEEVEVGKQLTEKATATAVQSSSFAPGASAPPKEDEPAKAAEKQTGATASKAAAKAKKQKPMPAPTRTSSRLKSGANLSKTFTAFLYILCLQYL